MDRPEWPGICQLGLPNQLSDSTQHLPRFRRGHLLSSHHRSLLDLHAAQGFFPNVLKLSIQHSPTEIALPLSDPLRRIPARVSDAVVNVGFNPPAIKEEKKKKKGSNQSSDRLWYYPNDGHCSLDSQSYTARLISSKTSREPRPSHRAYSSTTDPNPGCLRWHATP